MHIIKSGKTKYGRNITAKPGKNPRVWSDGYLQVLGNIGSERRGERKCKKRLPQKNEKTSLNPTLDDKSYQRDIHIDDLPCMAKWSILSMEKGGNKSTRELMTKHIVLCLGNHKERPDISRKGGRRLTCIKEFVDT